MESLTKQLLIKSSIGLLFLMSGSSNATPENAIQAMDNTLTKNNYAFLLPNVAPQGIQSSTLFSSSQHYSSILAKSSNTVTNRSCGKKRNELYELSTILSDKLHVFLSYFEDSPAYQFADKREDKESLPIEG
ncbi:hypothetical protein [Thalassotalea sediminis]|uniref:hypothetical protein n=1 Tax=Thalassotalea sediminis TaxID=1759089 RepID=UPI002572981D|nr:hypothetical protein [Thalassotalea sediminis]